MRVFGFLSVLFRNFYLWVFVWGNFLVVGVCLGNYLFLGSVIYACLVYSMFSGAYVEEEG
jgi:hypothetical protein